MSEKKSTSRASEEDRGKSRRQDAEAGRSGWSAIRWIAEIGHFRWPDEDDAQRSAYHQPTNADVTAVP